MSTRKLVGQSAVKGRSFQSIQVHRVQVSSAYYFSAIAADQPIARLTADFNRAITIDVPIPLAGAFAFYTTYSPLPDFSIEDVPSTKPTRTPTYYLDVAPKLSLQGSLLPITGLSICSTISKLMGKNSIEWDHHLRGIGQRGYNMVHFTPLMIRGSSNSPYSLYDMINFDKTAFPNGEKDVAVMIAKMEKDFGLLGMTDIVLNHTANNSHWLQDHPDAGYNIKTAPWLEAAEELDLALLNFGKKLASLGLPTELKSEYDLNRVMEAVKSKCIGELRLWEYYVLDVERDSHAAVKSWSSGNATLPSKGGREAAMSSVDGAKTWSPKQKVDWLLNNALAGNDRMGERFRKTLQPQAAAVLITALFGDFKSHPDQAGVNNAVRNLLNDLNVEFYREYDSDLGAILSLSLIHISEPTRPY